MTETERKFKVEIMSKHILNQWSDGEINKIYNKVIRQLEEEQRERSEAYD